MNYESRLALLQSYLDNLEFKSALNHNFVFSLSTIRLAKQVWNNIYSYEIDKGKKIKVPIACPSSNEDSFMFSWHSPPHYLECEIFDKNNLEYYYMNFETEEDWLEECSDYKHISIPLSYMLELFLDEDL